MEYLRKLRGSFANIAVSGQLRTTTQQTKRQQKINDKKENGKKH
jgi:hypothetical protein